MKAIRKRRNCYAVLFVAGVFLAAWSAVRLMVATASVFGAASIALLMLLIKQSRLLYDASLIRDNSILAVPSAVISMPGDKEQMDKKEVVVSTFGIMIGSKIYKWGRTGVDGVRLNTVDIDRTRIYLTFGDGTKTIRIELLHGMADEQAMKEVKERLWRETGVKAIISGW